MRYIALACDYDGTLARDGKVSPETVAALERTLASGRRLVLVTGREIEDVRRAFDRLDLFERVVAENGGVLHRPGSRETTALAGPPAPELVEKLRRREVQPLSVGQVVVATWHPHEETVLACIRELGLEHQVIFNKGAVMVLPPGVNKASGLAAALQEMGLSPHNVVGIGDAENDHAFLSACEASVAVCNALPGVKNRCDLVTRAGHGDGVAELADRLLEDDLAGLAPQVARHDVALGEGPGGSTVAVPAYGGAILVAGPSGSGKSTLVRGFLDV